MNVYQVEIGDLGTPGKAASTIDGAARIRYLQPSVGDQFRGFDGARIHHAPELPAIVLSDRLANRLLKTRDDVDAFEVDVIG